jgi:hypothetical protein
MMKLRQDGQEYITTGWIQYAGDALGYAYVTYRLIPNFHLFLYQANNPGGWGAYALSGGAADRKFSVQYDASGTGAAYQIWHVTPDTGHTQGRPMSRVQRGGSGNALGNYFNLKYKSTTGVWGSWLARPAM